MSENEEQPEVLVEEADMFDLLNSSNESNGVLGAPAPASDKTTSLAEGGVYGHVRPFLRAITVGAVGLAVMVIGALALTQGLTAALRTSVPERVAGISSSGDVNAALSVETKIMAPAKRAEAKYVEAKPTEAIWQTEVTSSGSPQPLAGQKFAEIRDVAQGADPSNRVRIVPDSGVSGRDYMPQDYQPNMPTSGTVITLPISQGRLLKFDEPVESVFIADPTVADIRVVAQDLVYVYGKRSGRTNLMAISTRSEGGTKVTASALLRIILDPAAPNEVLDGQNVPAQISFLGSRTDITGKGLTPEQAIRSQQLGEAFSDPKLPPYNNATLAESNQINIRVRFAEINRNDLKSFGIDWSLAVNAGGFQFGLQRAGNTNPANPNLSTTNGNGIPGTGKIGNFNLNVIIDALQRNGALTVLAEPNLTAVTGKTASFLAGGEFPILVPVTANVVNQQNGQFGGALTAVQYKPFGVSLDFTPTIIKEDRIAMTVKPEVSAIDAANSVSQNGFVIPAFTVRRAETTVEVASGQTFAIAGLFQRSVNRNIDKMPGLGDVPVLGELFRSERYQRNETELVILITPYFVNPVSDKHLATPLDRMDTNGPDLTRKGATLTRSEADKGSGFIMK